MFPFSLEEGLLYGLTGILTGLVSGVLGVGGGIIVVPALLFIFKMTHAIPEAIQMHVAAGSSLVIMIFTSQSSVRAHYRLKEISWNIFSHMWPFIALGTMSGAVLAVFLSTRFLEVIFGIFLFIISINMIFTINIQFKSQYPRSWIHQLICFAIGLKSGLLGVGGGLLIIPYLTYCGIETKRIPSVSALCTFVVSIIGTITVIFTGIRKMGDLPYTTGFIYWPAVISIALFSMIFAQIGAHITYKLPVKQLKYAFIGLLFLTSLNLLM